MKALSEVKPDILLGIVEMTNDEYHAHPALSNSGCAHLLQSPAHYIANRLNPEEPTDAQVIGTAAHFAILEPLKFAERYVRQPEEIERRAGKIWEAFREAHAEKDILRARDYDNVVAMSEAFYSHPTASAYLRGGETEKSVFWIDPETGVHCKSRPDYLRKDGIIVDLKTTEDASFFAFQKSIANYGYHRQASIALDGLREVTGNEHVGFVTIAIEKSAPYGIGVYVLNEDAIGTGRRDFRRAVTLFAECSKTGVWPCYPSETRPMDLPGWVK